MRIEGNFEKFFAQYPQYETKIRENLAQSREFIQNYPHKIKTVKNCKYHNKTIYEYKIHLDSHLDCRVAYVFLDSDIVFFYISTNIIKASFSKEVLKIQGVCRS